MAYSNSHAISRLIVRWWRIQIKRVIATDTFLCTNTGLLWVFRFIKLFYWQITKLSTGKTVLNMFENSHIKQWFPRWWLYKQINFSLESHFSNQDYIFQAQSYEQQNLVLNSNGKIYSLTKTHIHKPLITSRFPNTTPSHYSQSVQKTSHLPQAGYTTCSLVSGCSWNRNPFCCILMSPRPNHTPRLPPLPTQPHGSSLATWSPLAPVWYRGRGPDTPGDRRRTAWEKCCLKALVVFISYTDMGWGLDG